MPAQLFTIGLFRIFHYDGFRWFSSLVFILSHPRVAQLLEKTEKYIIKILGSFFNRIWCALAICKEA
jgi:hypothetical protein